MTRRTCITRPALLALALAGVTPAQAGVSITIAESGGNITMTGSGNINTSGLTAGSIGPSFGSFLRAAPFVVGAAPSSGGSVRLYRPVTGPVNIGSGTTFASGSNTGDIFIIYGGAEPGVELSSSYTSGASLSFSSTFTGKTLVGMGITPGTYTYTLGNADTVVVTVNPPPVVDADGTCGTPPGGVTAAGTGGTVYTSLTSTSSGLCSAGSVTANSFTANTANYVWGCDGVSGGAATAATACTAPRGYTVTPSAGSNGTISPNTAQVIAANATTPFTVTPATNFNASVTGCGGSLSGTTYTTGGVTADCTVSATFSPNAPPVASAVVITGTPQAGQTLTGSFTYSDAESDAQGTSLFKWKRADNATATPVVIDGATATTYVPVTADEGKRLQFCVTPVATTGATNGAEACSTVTACITGSSVASCGSVNTDAGSKSATVSDANNNPATLTISGGNGAEQIVYVRRVTNAGSPPAGSGLAFNNGLFDYLVTGLTAGGSITVTITLPAGTPTPTALYKCKNGSCAVPVLTSGESMGINGNVITLILKDGGALDQDGNASNGQILDPIAPAFTTSSSGTGGGFPPTSGGGTSSGGTTDSSGTTGSTTSGTTGGTTSGTSGGTTTTTSSGGCALGTPGSDNSLHWLALLALLGFIARRRQSVH